MGWLLQNKWKTKKYVNEGKVWNSTNNDIKVHMYIAVALSLLEEFCFRVLMFITAFTIIIIVIIIGL